MMTNYLYACAPYLDALTPAMLHSTGELLFIIDLNY